MTRPAPNAVPSPSLRVLLAVTALATALAIGGCASTAIDANYASVQALSQEQLGTQLRWLTTDEARRRAQADADAMLTKPLGVDDAVRLALAYSPALQALLFEGAAASAAITQSARLPNPVFAFEHLARTQDGTRELEIGRMLSFSVLDLLLMPSRMRLADDRQQQARLKLAAETVQSATEARQAWIQAVAAQQSLQYFEQVRASADASAELARRMQSVGNYSKLQRAREQAFSADAVAQLARAQQSARSAREGLIRALGLNDAQALELKLPDRLPDLPAAARDEASITQAAVEQRLDIRMAQAELALSAHEQGLAHVTGWASSLELGVARHSETGMAPQRGYELQMALPIFDTGDALRSQAQATHLAALNRSVQVRINAGSQLRESYAAYRTAYDLARHYRDEIVPLRKTIAEENVLRYNAMLIGVFELLADAREQVGSVVQAIETQRDFWLADAALQATLIGKPGTGLVTEPLPAGSGNTRGH